MAPGKVGKVFVADESGAVEIHHTVPQCLLRLHYQAHAGELDGARRVQRGPAGSSGRWLDPYRTEGPPASNAKLSLMEVVKGPRVFEQLDRCIYCAASDLPLQDEHIIPLCLNGQWMLRNASCERCAAITSALERSVCRDSLLKERAALGLLISAQTPKPRILAALCNRG
jgi:hypothetical protein